MTLDFVRILVLVVWFAASLMAQVRPSLVPLLWTQGQPAETIRKAVQEVAYGGNTGFVWESRPHPDYLGRRWWSDLDVAIGEAEKHGLEVWIFDEWMYPSGVAGGRVVERDKRFALHTVEERSLTITGPGEEKTWQMPGALEAEDRVASVMAFRARQHAGTPLSLGKSTQVRWAAPEGNWRITWSIVRSHPPKAGWQMSNMIDVMNPAATQAFIEITHEATYRHFARHFGKTIKGFFSDETGFRNVTSYQSLPGTPGMPMPWSPIFAEYFRRLKGYDVEPWLPALWHDLGPEGRRTRYDFVDVATRAFAENFFKPQQDWCRKHGVRFIGHLVEDNHADHNLGYGPGHWFRSIRHLDMPGVDVVGYQVTPGIDAGEVAWTPGTSTPWDMEFFQFGMPAMARGAALLQGTREIFSEAFGAYGWSEGLRMVKWIGDWHIVNGLSVLSPHAYTMKYNDPDCPPHFNRTSGTPQWRHYAEWTRQFLPLQRLLLETDPVYDAAVLYTAESKWVGPAQSTAPVVRALENHHVSTVVLPYEALEKERVVREGAWQFRGQRFRSVTLPYVRFLPGATAASLAELAAHGVQVVMLEAWPEASVDARADDQVRAAVADLKKSDAAVLTTLWELPAVIRAGQLRFEPANISSLASARRRGNGQDWVILQNRSLAGYVRGRVALDSTSRAALMEPATGKYFAVEQRQSAGKLAIEVDMPPYALWALRLSDSLPKLEHRPVYTASDPIRVGWEVSRATDDMAQQFQPLGRFEQLADWRRWPGLKSYSGTVRYRAVLPVSAGQTGSVGLDAGRVEETADLRVNGQALGSKISPPYTWDISRAVKAGENVIEIDVTNTALARWPDGFSHGDAVSGLLGPVRIMYGAGIRP